ELSLLVHRDVHGEAHPDTARNYENLAVLLSRQGREAEAWPLHLRAIATLGRALGEDHLETAHAQSKAAYTLYTWGRRAEAARLWQASLPAQEAARVHKAASGFARARA